MQMRIRMREIPIKCGFALRENTVEGGKAIFNVEENARDFIQKSLLVSLKCCQWFTPRPKPYFRLVLTSEMLILKGECIIEETDTYSSRTEFTCINLAVEAKHSGTCVGLDRTGASPPGRS